MAELEFAAAAAVADTYAVADVGVGLHNWYKLNKNTNGLVTKVSFFGQCGKMQLIPLKNFIIRT